MNHIPAANRNQNNNIILNTNIINNNNNDNANNINNDNDNTNNNNNNNNNIRPIVRIVGNQMQIIFIGNNPPQHSVFNQYATNYMLNIIDLLMDLLIQEIRNQHTLFRNVLQPISRRVGILGTIFGAGGVIFGKNKLREFLIWTIPLVISSCILEAFGGPFGWIAAGYLSVVYGKIVSTAYDGRVTDDSDLTMIEMIAALLILILLPTPPDEGGGGDGSYESNDNDNGDDGGKNGGSSAKNPGGVEFKNIQPIIGIKSPELYLSTKNNIFFKLENEKDILDAFNMLVLPSFQKRNIREYFDTIMKEASDSINSQIDLPFVSLHFNNNGFLYSVMHNFYKNTLIGNVLAFIDYFMKGFVNGGFFSIDFVRQWASTPPNQRITSTDNLNANLINVKKELQKAGVKSTYFPLNEIIDQDRTAQEFYSAFRIIGKMKGIGKADEILFPIETFSVEYDLDTKPEIQKRLDSDDQETTKYYNHVQSMYVLMTKIIKTTMPQVPQFRGLFPILDMITFAFHYTISLRSIGKAVNTQFAFQNGGENVQYIPPIPDIFPPLPVAEKREIKTTIKMTEVIECISETSFNNEITNILNSEQEEFSQKCLNQIIKEIEVFYKRKIKEAIGSDEQFDDQTIHLNSFKEKTIEFIKNIPNLFKNELYKLLSYMEEIIKIKDPSIEETPNTLTFFELVMKSQERLDSLTKIVNENDQEGFQPVQEFLDQLRNYERQLSMMIQVPFVVNALQKVRNHIQTVENAINDVEARKAAKNSLLESLGNQIMNLSRTAESFLSTYNETLKDYSTESKFYLVTPKIKDIDHQYNRIIGGCKVRFSRNSFIQTISKSEKELMEINTVVRDINKKESFIRCSNGISGLVMKLEIIPLPVDGVNLKYSSFLKELVKSEKEGSKSRFYILH